MKKFLVPFSFSVAACALFVLYIFFSSNKSFPILPAGTYSGTISGIGNLKEKKYTFFIEHQKNNLMHLIVFINKWQPQIIELEKDSYGKYSPLEIKYNEKIYTLTGSLSKDDLSGSVKIKDQKIGNWSLKKITLSPINNIADEKFTKWLALKGEFFSLKEQKKKIKKEIKSQQKLISSLSETLKNKDLLTKKASEQIEILNKEIQEQKALRESNESKLISKVKKIKQLQRISKKGRTVDLARRVRKRENQWYLVNWNSEYGSSSNSEEEIARSMNIDYRKLKHKLSQTEEYLRIKNELNREKAQIAELRSLSEGRAITTQPKEQLQSNEEEKTWWEKWDTKS